MNKKAHHGVAPWLETCHLTSKLISLCNKWRILESRIFLACLIHTCRGQSQAALCLHEQTQNSGRL